MTEDEIERVAEELQQSTPPPQGHGRVIPWKILTPASKEFWRGKVRRGERAL